jgi:hypothetical protein
MYILISYLPPAQLLINPLFDKKDILGLEILIEHYGPGIDSASNRNEYQEYSWG